MTDSSSPCLDRARRRLLLAAPVLAGALARPRLAQGQAIGRWSAAWGCAPAGPPPNGALAFSNQTLRLVVRPSIGGDRVRIRLSNEMGALDLRIGHATIGVRSSGASVNPGSLRQLSFGGQAGIRIPPGAPAVSDPVTLGVTPFADLSISLYLPDAVSATTIHNIAYQANYASTPGDHCNTPALPQQQSFSSWPFLTEVAVDSAAPVLVAVGDSLTDGAGSTSNANRRWTDFLARRAASEPGAPLAVVNRGISANRLLADNGATLNAGKDVLERFDRDVLATSGVRALAILIGINDISYSPSANPIPAEQLIAGYLQLVERARLRGIVVLGSTLPPFANFVYYTAARENVRQAVNAWMRSSVSFDALIDADLALRDPEAPLRLRAGFDSGDHLHPNDAGYQALAAAVPLGVLSALRRHAGM